jgi:acetoacetate decarboxylase
MNTRQAKKLIKKHAFAEWFVTLLTGPTVPVIPHRWRNRRIIRWTYRRYHWMISVCSYDEWDRLCRKTGR